MLHDLRESGDLKSWAETSVDAVKYVLSFLQPIYTAAKGLVAVFGTMLAGAAALDESGKNGEGWFNFSKAADVAQRFWDDFWDNDKDSAEKAQEAVWDGEEKKRRQAEREQQEALRRQAEREQQKNALIAAEKKRLEQRAAAEEEAEIKRQAKLEQELYESEYENMEEQARLEAQESID